MTTTYDYKAIVVGGPRTRSSISRLLQNCRCTPQFVGSLRELRSHLGDQEPILVILDLDAEFDAQLDVCRALRASAETMLLPVIAVSRLARNRSAAFEAGVDECVLRPIQADDFNARMRALLRLSANHAERAKAQLEVEVERSEHLRTTFRRYVSPQVADQIMARLDIHDAAQRNLLESARTNAAVMFADMRGFMGIAERLAPTEVFEMLNEFFAVLTEAAFKNEGTVFHMAGDCLMVGFGVPHQQTDGAQRAMKTAREMLSEFGRLAELWKQRYRIETGLGIGINEGEVIAGNLGSQHYMNYTLIGDTVNVAARLSQRARAGEVLFSNAFKIKLDARGLDVGAVELPPLTLRGRLTPIDIYCVPTEKRVDFRH